MRYGARTPLHDVSFEVPRGSVFALLGRNGAGKSSLVRCALGLQKPAHGAVRLFGENAWVSRCRAMARVGVVPEEPDAPPDMTTGELLAFLRPALPHVGRCDGAGPPRAFRRALPRYRSAASRRARREP